MFRKFFLLLLIVLVVDVCSAIVIHGTVYDTDLNVVDGCIVGIDSTPAQRFVSKDGLYSFNLLPGSYVLSAKCGDMSASETLTVKDDSGDYVIDLFLFPTFEEEDELLNDTNLDVSDAYFDEPSNFALIFSLVFVLAMLVFFLWVKLRKHPKEEVKQEPKVEEKIEFDDLDSVIEFIKHEGGRVTQKDIRKKFPLSEAKISLIISELEHKGVVEKIKKGRGNIVVLKK